MKRRLAAIVLLLIAAGCGASSGTATPPDRVNNSVTTHTTAGKWETADLPDPCRVVTNTEVAQILGRPVAPGVRQETWPPSCRLTITDGAGGAVFVLDDSAATGEADFVSRQRSPAATPVDIGYGRAIWMAEDRALDVLVGSTRLQVVVGMKDAPPNALDQAKAIALIAAPRAVPH